MDKMPLWWPFDPAKGIPCTSGKYKRSCREEHQVVVKVTG